MNIQFSIRRYFSTFILRHQNLRQLLCLQLLLLVLFNFVATISFSQISQNGIFFQAVAKDNYDNPANRRQLFLQSTIIQSNTNGSKVLIEEFQTTTDQMGIFNFTIGKGVRKGGKFYNLNEIDWANGPYYLNIKIVITPVAPGANWDYNKEWVDIGTTSFGTVPYALFASSSGDLGNKVNVSDSILRYVTPTQLAVKSFDISPILKSLSEKLDKVDGKQLTSNDYTNAEKIKLNEISGINTGDETLLSIKSKLGITVLNGVNTGDQDLSPFATKLALDVNTKVFDSVLSQKVNIADHTAIILTSKNAVDHFFRIAEEVRFEVPDTMKYFCISEVVAKSLQKYVTYRKRKIFFGKQTIEELVEVMKKHKGEKYLLPCTDILRDKIPITLEEHKINFTKAILYKTPKSPLRF
jgi:hypothetical protein